MPHRALVLFVGCCLLTACSGSHEDDRSRTAASREEPQASGARAPAASPPQRPPRRSARSSQLPAFSAEELSPAAERDSTLPTSPSAVPPPPDRWQPPRIDASRVEGAGIRKLESARLTLYTDLPSQPAVDELPEVFAAAVPLWCEYFAVPMERAGDWHMTASIMRDKDAFLRAGLLPEDLPPFLHGYQHYAQMWVYEQPSDYYRRHLLLHEGTHAFMNWALGGTGPPWYMEGMAELLATHRWQDGKLELGIFPQSRDETPYLGRIKIIRDETSAGRGQALEEILRYDERAHLNVEPYAWCWAAAAFLDGQSAYRKPFRRLRSSVRLPGHEFSDSFQNALAAQWSQIQRQWQLFVAELDYGYDLAREFIPPATVRPLPAEGIELQVAVDRGWQSAGIQLDAGRRYRIEARGRYQLKQEPQVWWCEPNGVTIRYCRGLPLGMLLGAVVDEQHAAADAAPLLRPGALGLGVETRPGHSGTLYLRINDYPAELADNVGQLAVSVHPLPD